ncbi:MAG: hypothetical protein ABIP80_02270, partial [Ferruginibacter sp.]
KPVARNGSRAKPKSGAAVGSSDLLGIMVCLFLNATHPPSPEKNHCGQPTNSDCESLKTEMNEWKTIERLLAAQARPNLHIQKSEKTLRRNPHGNQPSS